MSQRALEAANPGLQADRQALEGRNADVWKAVDDQGRAVAIKVLRSKNAKSENYARFQREVREHARLTDERFAGVLPLLDHSLPDAISIAL